jgi:hypothetical protein
LSAAIPVGELNTDLVPYILIATDIFAVAGADIVISSATYPIIVVPGGIPKPDIYIPCMGDVDPPVTIIFLEPETTVAIHSTVAAPSAYPANPGVPANNVTAPVVEILRIQ